DEPLVASHPLSTGFDDVVRVGLAAGESEPTKPAESVEGTQMARLFAAATQLVERAREPFFLWLHARGMQGICDAPYAFREQYANEDEPPPPTIVAPPQRHLTADDDPDHLWGICQAYAGQITLVDDCLGALWESLEDEQLSDDTLLVVLGARGFPLGRNGRLGDVDQIVSWIWDWYADPIGSLATQLNAKLDGIQRLIVDGSDDVQGLRSRLKVYAEERARVRASAVLAVLRVN
ncbi:MAG: sulfatase-like hydrolase/transferase, partial [Pirellulales bacterium]